MRLFDVGTKECPGGSDDIGRRVDAHVTNPLHAQPHVCEWAGKAGGLRIVQDRDVAGADEIEQRDELAAKHAHVHLSLLLSQGAAVTLGSMQPVVEPLRYPEEVLVSFDDDPSAPDPSFDQIAEELME